MTSPCKTTPGEELVCTNVGENDIHHIIVSLSVDLLIPVVLANPDFDSLLSAGSFHTKEVQLVSKTLV